MYKLTMTAFGVIQLHDDITRSNGLYCCVCFRSSLERRLVAPVNFKIFLKSTVGNKPFKNTQVCYVCEALATSAVKFQKAVKFASVVGELYADIAKSRQWQQVINALMNAQAKCAPKSNVNFNLVYTKSEATTNPIVTRAVAIDKKLRSMNRFDLFRTDTLVVSSLQSKPEQRPPLTDTVVVVNEPKTSPRNRVTGNVSVMPEQMIMSVVNEQTNNMVLHPLVKGLDGNVYVPSLNLQIVDKDQLKSVPDVLIQKFMPTPPLPPITNNSNPLPNNNSGILQSHLTQNAVNQSKTIYNPINSNTISSTITKAQINKKIEKSNEKSEYQNFLLNQMREKTRNDRKKRKVIEDPLEISMSDVQLILNENAQGSGEVQFEIIDDDIDDDDVAESRPVLRTDRTVDWEDKIPMDVISFIDATDPAPHERIMQPPLPAPPPAALGVIADVRTVADVTEHNEIECIDLC